MISKPVTLSVKKDGTAHLTEKKVAHINKPHGKDYICGLSKTRSDNYIVILQQLRDAINNGCINTIGEAKAELARSL